MQLGGNVSPRYPLLSVGVDTLYWSSRVAVGPWFDDLREARTRAAEGGEAIAWRVVDGFALDVLPYGAFRYPVVVDCREFRLHVTDSSRLPTLWVQLRSAFIHEVGLERAIAESVAVARALVGVQIAEPKASRLDLYADFGGWVIVQADRAGLVTHADLRAHFRAGTEEFETVQAGKSPFLVRLYRKDLEVRQRGGFAPAFWNGWVGAVTRAEVQAGSEKLRAFGISSVAEALASRGDVWRYATSEFLELRVPTAGPRESWSVRDEWRAVQSIGAQAFPASGVVPFVVVQGDRLRILRALYGYLTSLGAIDTHRTLARVLRLLPGQLEEVERGRSFSDEVERKRRRLPRAVRSNVDSAAASAGSGKEAPWAPDPLHENTRTDG
jgi:hypothetical protein